MEKKHEKPPESFCSALPTMHGIDAIIQQDPNII